MVERNRISVIVPVYNDPTGVAETLACVTNLDSGVEQLHTLVVDNNSTDDTRDVIREYVDENDNVTLLIEDETQSSYAARNKGIEYATGDVLAFLDADETVDENWAQRVRKAINEQDADYMGCNVELTLPENPTLAAKYDAHTGFPVKQYIEHQHFAPTCCLFVRREVFEDIGLFDHRLISGGDKEFGNRVHDAGYDMHFAENVTMYHPVRDSLRALAKKDFRVGRGLCQLQRYHPDRYGEPGVPPRPSGLKSPDQDLPRRDRLAFGALSTAMTGIRGLGYYREYVEYLRSSDDESLPDPRELDLESNE